MNHGQHDTLSPITQLFVKSSRELAKQLVTKIR